MVTKKRAICDIAKEIKITWKNVYFAAVPYLDAMLELETLDDVFGVESADHIVTRFLGAASYWRGEDARRIKQELKNL